MRKIWTFIKNSFRKNLMLKIVSVLFAVILWSYVMVETNPVREKTVNNVEVTFTGVQELEENGFAVVGNLDSLLETVSVRVSAQRSELQNVSNETLKATVDLSKITSAGSHELEVSAYSTFGLVSDMEISPSTVRVETDTLLAKSVPVEYEIIGDVDSNLYLGEPTLAPDVIQVSGAQSEVEKVAKATVQLSGPDITQSINQSYRPVLMAEDGSVIDQQETGIEAMSVIVRMEVLPKKTVPINTSNLVIGTDQLKTGYEVKSITVTPSSVEIAGAQELLDQITSIDAETINVEGKDSNVIETVQLRQIEGITIIGGVSEVEVVVNIDQIQRTETIADKQISVVNRTSGTTVEVTPETVDVAITAGVNTLEQMNKSDFDVYVDVDGLGKGTHKVKLGVEGNGLINEENIKLSTEYVTVVIS